jgi:hypothetical protein
MTGAICFNCSSSSGASLARVARAALSGRDRDQREGIARRHTEKQVAEKAGSREGSARPENQSRQSQFECLARHQPHYGAA